jgi:hypothetical protein
MTTVRTPPDRRLSLLSARGAASRASATKPLQMKAGIERSRRDANVRRIVAGRLAVHRPSAVGRPPQAHRRDSVLFAVMDGAGRPVGFTHARAQVSQVFVCVHDLGLERLRGRGIVADVVESYPSTTILLRATDLRPRQPCGHSPSTAHSSLNDLLPRVTKQSSAAAIERRTQRLMVPSSGWLCGSTAAGASTGTGRPRRYSRDLAPAQICRQAALCLCPGPMRFLRATAHAGSSRRRPARSPTCTSSP